MVTKQSFADAIFSELDDIADRISKGDIKAITIQYGAEGMELLIKQLRGLVKVCLRD